MAKSKKIRKRTKPVKANTKRKSNTYASQVAARKRRADIKKYGSVAKARATRRREQQEAWARKPPSESGLWSFVGGEWKPMTGHNLSRGRYETPVNEMFNEPCGYCGSTAGAIITPGEGWPRCASCGGV